jgi:hypothetical protein
MAHPEQREFCEKIKAAFPAHFQDVDALDVGSLDINGSNRDLFTNTNYVGLDLGEGKNVDVVGPVHKAYSASGLFDTVISTECFEHDKYYKKSLQAIVFSLVLPQVDTSMVRLGQAQAMRRSH